MSLVCRLIRWCLPDVHQHHRWRQHRLPSTLLSDIEDTDYRASDMLRAASMARYDDDDDIYARCDDIFFMLRCYFAAAWCCCFSIFAALYIATPQRFFSRFRFFFDDAFSLAPYAAAAIAADISSPLCCTAAASPYHFSICRHAMLLIFAACWCRHAYCCRYATYCFDCFRHDTYWCRLFRCHYLFSFFSLLFHFRFSSPYDAYAFIARLLLSL